MNRTQKMEPLVVELVTDWFLEELIAWLKNSDELTHVPQPYLMVDLNALKVRWPNGTEAWNLIWTSYLTFLRGEIESLSIPPVTEGYRSARSPESVIDFIIHSTPPLEADFLETWSRLIWNARTKRPKEFATQLAGATAEAKTNIQTLFPATPIAGAKNTK